MKQANNNGRNETRSKSDPRTDRILGYPQINIHFGVLPRSSFVVWVEMVECEAKMGSKTTAHGAEIGIRMECIAWVYPCITRRTSAAAHLCTYNTDSFLWKFLHVFVTVICRADGEVFTCQFTVPKL